MFNNARQHALLWSKLWTNFAAALALTMLTACATPYQKLGAMGGFDETRLAPNVWRVTFKGNGYTSTDRAEDLVLLRSAELAMQYGFPFFGFQSTRVETTEGSYTTPVTTVASGNAYRAGNTLYGSATATSYGGNTVTWTKPSTPTRGRPG